MPYSPPPIETDLDAVTARLFTAIAAAVPGWTPIEGTLDTAIIEEIGRETVLTNNQAVTSIELGVVGLGETGFGVAARIATPAEMLVQVNVTAAGTTIPAGLTVIGTTDVGVPVAFELLTSVVTTGTVQLVSMFATSAGTVGNGVQPGALILASGSADVTSVAALSASAGGVEAESRTEYLNRLTDMLSITRTGLVRASDLELYARHWTGVRRALAFDLYDSVSGLDNVERTATVFVVDQAGQPVGAATKAALTAAVQSLREVNFVARVADPTYTTVTVAFTATAEPSYSAAAVQAAVIAAVNAYLSPATWGATDADPRDWNRVPTVGYLNVAAAIGAVPGLASLTTLTLNGGVVDVTLAGKAPLPAPVVAGTVT